MCDLRFSSLKVNISNIGELHLSKDYPTADHQKASYFMDEINKISVKLEQNQFKPSKQNFATESTGVLIM